MLTGTTLLINDEAVLRQAVARTLESEGYTVLQLLNDHLGLQVLRKHAAE